MPKLSDYINAAIADVFRAAYREENMSQQNLSDKTGINMTTMQRLMSGKSTFDVNQVAKLSDGVGISPVEIMRRAESRAQRKLAEAMSEVGATVTPIGNGYTQAEADRMTVEDVESSEARAAYRDDEANTDEPENP